VFGVHGVGGIVGCLMTGLLASKTVSGSEGSIAAQLVDAAAVIVYSGVMTAILLLVTKFIVGLRPDENAELTGLDISQHRERITA
jgi:Amt family ammonium transporter